ncbi:UNVERIFIED_CONTAM: hypothetical protein PYX00_006791 [Menopon gallinae]|uniref:CCHC-type domain-containing protein n=1 Tax=Menopon gallinae TaxID=328185 RepID=A0AAW2HXP6_9NEOP
MATESISDTTDAGMNGTYPSLRCFKCFQFGHKANECKTSEEALKKIGEYNHAQKCSNCVLKAINEKMKSSKKTDLNTGQISEIMKLITHKTFGYTCPTFVGIKDKISLRYNYG